MACEVAHQRESLGGKLISKYLQETAEKADVVRPLEFSGIEGGESALDGRGISAVVLILLSGFLRKQRSAVSPEEGTSATYIPSSSWRRGWRGAGEPNLESGGVAAMARERGGAW